MYVQRVAGPADNQNHKWVNLALDLMVDGNAKGLKISMTVPN